jgi:hypothetical protein
MKKRNHDFHVDNIDNHLYDALDWKSNTAVTFCRHEALQPTQHFENKDAHMSCGCNKVLGG